MKQRFSSLDVKVTAHELSQALAGLRLANIYDISSKKLLLKFAVSGNKQQLIIDSGFRTHLTDFTRATAAAPSAFTSRLRKFLKTRRCTSLCQIGTDRIIELQFSDGAYRLYLEFFAAGNIILTDADLKILALMRNVPEGQGQEAQRVGLTYTLQNRQNYAGIPPLTKDRVRAALTKSADKAVAADTLAKKKPSKKKPEDELRRGLTTTLEELPPIVLDHAFDVTGFAPTAKPAEVLASQVLFDAVFKALEEARRIVDEVTSSTTCKGYIIAKERETHQAAVSSTAQPGKPQGLVYEDFQPFLPRKYEKNSQYTVLTFDNFNKTIDEFFSSVEGQKLEARLSDREAAAERKLEAVRQIQEQKVQGLKQIQMLNLRKAGAIEANADRVSEAMEAVNGLISQGMDWVHIGKLIEREQKRRNPVAEIIKLPLDLEHNTITLLLAEEDVEEDGLLEDDSTSEEEETDEEEEDGQEGDGSKPADTKLAIEIDLSLTPFANAREYYDQRKVAAVKQQKTVEQSATALKSAERKIAQDLKKGLKTEKPTLHLVRRQMWFEKFLWFISSDGYLVVGGRDAAQNELLYKKHLRKGDVYVHADMHGAATVIIKNDPKALDAPIPPSTLAQAGSLSVCSSNAWDSKAGMGAWWVKAEQVSKSAPTGEYLPTGSFMVRGNKNILTPQPLILGFGFLFKISEESKVNHVKHRLLDGTDSGAGNGSAKPAGTCHVDESQTPVANGSEQQGQHDADSDEEQDGTENHARQNPLQTNGDGDQDSDGNSDSDSDSHIDADIDHVRDDMRKLGVEQSTDTIMMSGALMADADEQEPLDGTRDEELAEADDGSGSSDAEHAGSEVATEAATEAPAESGQGKAQHANGTKTKKAPPKRGQRAKQKKISSKYKDQDEEDRAMYEELIGAAKGRQKAEAEAKARAERLADEEARRERRKQAVQKHQQKMMEQEEVRRVMLDEGLEVLDEGEEQAATPLDALVGTPFVGDEIVEAIPVCAPWAAMAKCKYKAKMQPGATKKGKAIKEILERWKVDATKKGNVDEQAKDTERMWPREVELIKTVKPEDAHNVVPVGKMTVMMAGGSSGGGGGKGGKGGGGGGQGKGGGKGGKGGKKK